ncbi:hypothetical protein AB1N83_003582, partial [Pleurotus pulmonarius]
LTTFSSFESNKMNSSLLSKSTITSFSPKGHWAPIRSVVSSTKRISIGSRIFWRGRRGRLS